MLLISSEGRPPHPFEISQRDYSSQKFYISYYALLLQAAFFQCLFKEFTACLKILIFNFSILFSFLLNANWQQLQVIPISDSICGSPLLELVYSLSSIAWMLELQMAAGISYRYLHLQCHKLQYGLSSLHSLPSVKFTHTTFQSYLTRAISMYRIRMECSQKIVAEIVALLSCVCYSPASVLIPNFAFRSGSLRICNI